MGRKVGVILSATALVVAVLGITPLGGAAWQSVQTGKAPAASTAKQKRGPRGPRGRRGPAGVIGTLNQAAGLNCRVPGGAAGKTAIMFEPDPVAASGNPATRAGHHYTNVYCVTPDSLEQNDSRSAPTSANTFVAPAGGRFASATIYPAGGDDWYRLDGTNLQGRNILLDWPTTNAPSSVSMDVYKDGAVVASGVRQYTTDGAPHTWDVRVHSSGPAAYTVWFNATWTVATSPHLSTAGHY